MGTRELFLIIGTLVLFAVISLSVNMSLMSQQQITLGNEFKLGALSIAQQYLEEAKTKAFDVVVAGGSTPANLPDDFTAPAELGPAPGEIWPNFNDIDDYDGFTDVISTPRNSYNVSISVFYVSDTTPDTTAAARTFFKRMEVTIDYYNMGDPDTLQAGMVFGFN